jgi:hypothetical protein
MHPAASHNTNNNNPNRQNPNTQRVANNNNTNNLNNNKSLSQPANQAKDHMGNAHRVGTIKQESLSQDSNKSIE